MNAPSNFPQTKTRHSGRTRRFNSKLAAGLAFACLGAALLLPVLKSRTGYHHRMPPGQFQADMRTMIAGMRYLLQSEETTYPSPVVFPGLRAQTAQHPAGGTLEMSDRASNQTSTPAGSSANPPAPI